MRILSIRTDKPDAEIGLFDSQRQVDYEIWTAHRELSSTIQLHLEGLLKRQATTLDKIEGLVVYKGPGSFTGLRIGLSIANALAYALDIPIVAKENPQWLARGIDELLSGKNEKSAIPEYGAPVHVT